MMSSNRVESRADGGCFLCGRGHLTRRAASWKEPLSNDGSQSSRRQET